MADLDASESKMKAKEVLVVQDTGKFTHSTGDTYEGFFEVKKKDMSVKMHGQGVYTTAEGDTYSGRWEADRLMTAANEVATISYNDTSQYTGSILNWCYAGPGQYRYPDNSVLTGSFVDNCPLGNLSLVDPNGHKWLGKADQGFGWFEPVNHFYELLEKSREPKVTKRKDRKESLASAYAD